ncbi:hypothetical protein CIK05_07825 [Bdellovibrio sp. qaytius]|nr:hypothetical protein CIK05_07825 [Bdellovibrio sp. qaytius]
MMKKHYYFYGSLIGLIIAAITAYSIMGHTFTNMISSFSNFKGGFIPITAGAWTALIIARWCDKTVQSKNVIYKGIIIPVFIFSVGVITGSLLNLMNSVPHQSFQANFIDFFFKPVYWLGLIGLPSAIIVGLTHYLVNANKN